MLDEPTSNLDSQGIKWYLEMMEEFGKRRLVLVCSNQAHEYEFCNHHLNIVNYK
jgi:ABC-type multidrug transport system ATPase subunit